MTSRNWKLQRQTPEIQNFLGSIFVSKYLVGAALERQICERTDFRLQQGWQIFFATLIETKKIRMEVKFGANIF